VGVLGNILAIVSANGYGGDLQSFRSCFRHFECRTVHARVEDVYGVIGLCFGMKFTKQVMNF
jgi:hypothetical protein